MAIKRAIKAGNKSIISFKKAIKVGEITQWCDKDKFLPSQTDRTLTFTNNGDGSVTVSGVVVNTARAIYDISNLKELIKGHKYLLSGCPKSTDNQFLSLNVYNNDGKLLVMYIDNGSGLIFTFDQEYYNRGVGGVYIYERTVGAEINRTYTPQLFDLTEMFGAGHEPATVAEFKAKFPEAYYPYQRAVLTVYNKVVRPCVRKGEVVQVADLSGFVSPYTRSGITFTNNGNGSITLNGTATADSYVILQPISKSIAGAVYLLGSEQNTLEYGVTNGLVLRADKWTYDPGVGATGAHTNYTLMVKNGATVNNVTIFPQIYNLTAMYGAGNEPKTLADFRKDFPESYYPYNSIHTKNLFNWSGKLRQGYDTANCTIVKILTNGAILQGNVGDATGSSFYGNGWFRPGSPYGYGTQISLSANDVVTISADYEIIERNYASPATIGVYLYGTEELTRLYVSPIETGVLYRVKETYTITKDGQYYPVFTLNSSKVKITNIQLEKGSVATDYVPHDYI